MTGENYGEQEKPFIPGFYGDVARRIYNNICYIANLLALKEWYFHIRRPFFQLQEMGEEFFIGLMNTLESMLQERITRFKDLSEKMEVSIALGEKMKRNNDFTALKKEFYENWPSIESCFKSGIERNIDLKTRQEFTEFIHNKICGGNKSYLHVVKMLDMRESAIGTLWLKNIVDGITICALSHLPSFRS
ncbi:MAG TPA: hypothetical protein VLJ60_06300 [bacterium]|nr:hypothetical protein [bacterium]